MFGNRKATHASVSMVKIGAPRRRIEGSRRGTGPRPCSSPAGTGPPGDEVRRPWLPDAHGGSVSKEAREACSAKGRAAVAGGKATLPWRRPNYITKRPIQIFTKQPLLFTYRPLVWIAITDHELIIYNLPPNIYI